VPTPPPVPSNASSHHGSVFHGNGEFARPAEQIPGREPLGERLNRFPSGTHASQSPRGSPLLASGKPPTQLLAKKDILQSQANPGVPASGPQSRESASGRQGGFNPINHRTALPDQSPNHALHPAGRPATSTPQQARTPLPGTQPRHEDAGSDTASAPFLANPPQSCTNMSRLGKTEGA
jgi:hypothetical protein